MGTPIERLFKLENDIYHPTYLDQPFVKLPNARPHESLNFEHGEIIYENTRVLEWVRFWQLSTFAGGAFFAVFVPFNMIFKTNLVTDAADEFVLAQYHLVSPAIMDIARVGVPVAGGAVPAPRRVDGARSRVEESRGRCGVHAPGTR